MLATRQDAEADSTISARSADELTMMMMKDDTRVDDDWGPPSSCQWVGSGAVGVSVRWVLSSGR